jgi:hypothetical protein
VCALVYLSEKPSLELCKSLIMLRDYNISGRIGVVDIPVLMHMLQFWRVSLSLTSSYFTLTYQKISNVTKPLSLAY